ncbi:hypothetical protein D3C76_1437510 [compost metagenome]
MLIAHPERAQLLQLLRLICLALPLELFGDDQALDRIAEQFTHLADLVFAHEAIGRHAALVARCSS